MLNEGTGRKILEDLAELFSEAKGMADLDAADFKDKAGEIFDLVLRARKAVNSDDEEDDCFTFQLAFDDHDSFYKVPKDFVRKLLDGERFGMDSVSQAIIEECEFAEVTGDYGVYWLDVEEDEKTWKEIEAELRDEVK
jgi:hypothetical protein